MARFSTTTTYEVHCPHCDEDRVIKVGIRNGQQRYECKNCKRKFRANGKAKGRQMNAELMGAAIRRPSALPLARKVLLAILTTVSLLAPLETNLDNLVAAAGWAVDRVGGGFAKLCHIYYLRGVESCQLLNPRLPAKSRLALQRPRQRPSHAPARPRTAPTR